MHLDACMPTQVPTLFPPPGLQAKAPEDADGVLQRFTVLWNKTVREAALLLTAHDARPHDPRPAMKLAALRDSTIVSFGALWASGACLPVTCPALLRADEVVLNARWVPCAMFAAVNLHSC